MAILTLALLTVAILTKALGRMAGVVTLGCGMRVRPQGDLVEVRPELRLVRPHPIPPTRRLGSRPA